ncbi:hypothetical protein KC335_g8081, partial [Hortaea werneckii]
GASGVDAEREKTYKTAEACTTRLTEMQHSLTAMIDELNSSSTKLSSTTTSQQQQQQLSATGGDPLADIVRVLNSHLAQLQTIDDGASSLQGKVTQAQRDARQLGGSLGGGMNGGGSGVYGGPDAGGWVEGFGRSYLGRGR